MWSTRPRQIKTSANHSSELIIQALTSHLKVYMDVSHLRASRKFTYTNLFSTQEVFSFSRSTDSADHFIVAMNVMEDEVTVSLEDIILMLGGNNTSAEVVIRSSGEDIMLM